MVAFSSLAMIVGECSTIIPRLCFFNRLQYGDNFNRLRYGDSFSRL